MNVVSSYRRSPKMHGYVDSIEGDTAWFIVWFVNDGEYPTQYIVEVSREHWPDDPIAEGSYISLPSRGDSRWQRVKLKPWTKREILAAKAEGRRMHKILSGCTNAEPCESCLLRSETP